MKTYRFALLSAVVLALAGSLHAATPTTATLEVTTVPVGGRYAPKHVLAVWITDSQDRLVKTVAVHAGKRKKYLQNWIGRAGKGATDGIVGATLKEHAAMTFIWDGTGPDGQVVPPGTYRWHIELTDRNKAGAVTPDDYLAFTVGPEASVRTPDDLDNFKKLKLTFTPAAP